AAAEGRLAVPGPVPARSGRRSQSCLGTRAPRTARRTAAHLPPDSERATQARRRPCGVAAIRPYSWRHSGSTGMNDNNLIQLMTIVERAVRPVQASTSRKRKMREELLAHVTGVFEEEAAKL